MSGFMSLNWRDVSKGLITAILSAVLAAIYNVLQASGNLSAINWKSIVTIGVIAGTGYLTKNFFTNSKDQMAPEPK